MTVTRTLDLGVSAVHDGHGSEDADLALSQRNDFLDLTLQASAKSANDP